MNQPPSYQESASGLLDEQVGTAPGPSETLPPDEGPKPDNTPEPAPPPNPDTKKPDELSDLHAALGGALAGSLAPLATSGLNAYNGEAALSFFAIPWGLILVFAIIGGIVAYFLADRVRHHVFTCGIAAPFLVLGVVNSHKAGLTDKATEAAEAAETKEKKATEETKVAKANEEVATNAARDAETNQQKAAEAAAGKPKPKLGSEGIEALIESEIPAL